MPGAGLVSGLVVAVVAAALAVIGRTKWLESHTLRKCVLLSVLLHAAIAVVFASLGGLRPASFGTAEDGPITMLVVAAEEPGDGVGPVGAVGAAADAALVDAAVVDAAVVDAAVVDAAVVDAAAAAAADVAPVSPVVVATTPPGLADASGPPEDHVPLLEAAPVPPADEEPRSDVVPESLAEAAGDGGGDGPGDAATDAADERSAAVAADTAGEASSLTPRAAAHAQGSSARRPHVVPETYADRSGGRRAGAAAARGGSAETERAVQAALAWLAAAQSEDGRWNAARHGAGVERAVQGHHRSGAGLRGDHGVTGLALLAFLGAGNTHEEGPYAGTVARGLAFLTKRQRADGALAGDAEFFAVLYCHGMASIAVAEALAMSGDEALRPVLERAVRYSLAMQSPATGGWRYAAGDKGDTSQLGWQLMLLSSARTAGLGGFESAEAGARSFLHAVSSGRAGGLAAYRPGERPGAAMTAEALFCRMLLGMPADHPAVAEGIEFLAHTPPDPRHPNAYAWYYSTLASFHVGGPQWEGWNHRLQAALLPLQRRESSGLDGSWDPDPVWGGHGGRVYATALAAMTLEVYYRHLPMHRRATATAAAAGRLGR